MSVINSLKTKNFVVIGHKHIYNSDIELFLNSLGNIFTEIHPKM